MNIKLKVAKGKDSGKRYVAIVCEKNNKEYYLTFDRITIMKITDLTFNQLDGLDFGYYEI